MRTVCKNIYWRHFIFSSAFNQLRGFTIIHIPNVAYTPGFRFKVQNKSCRGNVWHTNCVLESVCACVRAFWDGILQSTSIQYNESQGIQNKTKQRSSFTLHPTVHPHSTETQKTKITGRRHRGCTQMQELQSAGARSSPLVQGMWGC